ncbi:flagellar hook-basal body complex protein FliE [Methyloversatilis thermotolerans]|uniref:flagellar hook-basal body complex protein FliE n=1 Tax=Methyloversatilis thermotolerans TaxID=1346290 RepID=UPI00036DA4E6|nr:flagellar hook-basal body complex protein FliE [Methyloversatilis thermotolerans]
MGYEVAGKIAASKALIEADAMNIASALQMPSSGTSTGNPSGFASAMKDAVNRVDGMQHEASRKMEAVDAGQSDDLVGAMLASQEASLSFSMLMQVRNKVVGAVEDLIKLPI